MGAGLLRGFQHPAVLVQAGELGPLHLALNPLIAEVDVLYFIQFVHVGRDAVHGACLGPREPLEYEEV